MKTIYSQCLVLSLLLSAGFTVVAQKLPNVQTNSVTAPANIKIDGKATEWNNQFEAYNTAADSWYTIANDNDNLYLVLQSNKFNMINTIAGYGFELAIHKSGRKSDADKISIHYPVADKGGHPFTFGGAGGQVDRDTSADHLNELMIKNNKTIDQKFKWIVVKGIPGLDTLAIYNSENIQAASRMDNKKVYTLELAIPLKKLGLAVNGTSKFSYHVIFNGNKPPQYGNTPPQNIKVMDSSFHEVAVVAVTPEIQQGIDDLNMRIAKRNPHVDFWGEYELAKK